MPIYSMTGFARAQVRVPLPNEGQLSYTLSRQERESSLSRCAVAPAAGPGRAGDGAAQGAQGQPGARPRGSDSLHRSHQPADRPATIANWWTATLPPLPRRARSIGLTRRAGPERHSAPARRFAERQSRNGDEEQTALAESVQREIAPLLEQLKTMRAREGEALEAILHGTLDRLAEATEGVAALRPEVEERYQARLTAAAGGGHRPGVQPPAAAGGGCRAGGAQRHCRGAGRA